LLLKLSDIVFGLFKDGFVLRKISLQIFNLNVAVPYLIEHALDVGSQSVNTLGAALNTSHSVVHLVKLIL